MIGKQGSQRACGSTYQQWMTTSEHPKNSAGASREKAIAGAESTAIPARGSEKMPDKKINAGKTMIFIIANNMAARKVITTECSQIFFIHHSKKQGSWILTQTFRKQLQ